MSAYPGSQEGYLFLYIALYNISYNLSTLLLAWSCTLVKKPKTTEKGLKADKKIVDLLMWCHFTWYYYCFVGVILVLL
jgi:hypothetical protein